MTHPEAFGPLPDTTPEGRNEDHFQTPLQKAGTKLSATSWNLEKKTQNLEDSTLVTKLTINM